MCGGLTYSSSSIIIIVHLAPVNPVPCRYEISIPLVVNWYSNLERGWWVVGGGVGGGGLGGFI